MHNEIGNVQNCRAVSGDNDGAVSGMPSQEAEKLSFRCIVEMSRRLVQQPEPGIPQERARYGNSLTLAAGEPLAAPSDPSRKAAILIRRQVAGADAVKRA
jgi:hypothetical protein